MKYLITTPLLLCLLGTLVLNNTSAQNSEPWVEVSSNADYFHISMPLQPKEENQTSRYGELDVNGKRYGSSAEGASYTVWALINPNYKSTRDPDEYLDATADLIWEALLKPDRDKLPDDRRARAAMTYVKDLPAKPLPGREYSLAIGELAGTTRFYIADARIFVLLAMNSPGGVWASERFFASFATLPSLPVPPSQYEDPIGAGTRGPSADPNDYNRVFRVSEVTQRARVLKKPEPTYTESARKYSITGTVVLRAVFSQDGEVTNIFVVRKLPHGLTQQALKAARAIRFTPAMKDGRPVSMYIQLEYNFNLY